MSQPTATQTYTLVFVNRFGVTTKSMIISRYADKAEVQRIADLKNDDSLVSHSGGRYTVVAD